jgi:hypothetical protein
MILRLFTKYNGQQMRSRRRRKIAAAFLLQETVERRVPPS